MMPGLATCWFCQPHQNENETPSFCNSLFSKFRPRGTEFCGIQDGAEYNGFNGSENQAGGASFDEGGGAGGCTNRQVFWMQPGDLASPCWVLPTIPSRNDESEEG